MSFWTETKEAFKRSFFDFYEPIFHPIKYWWMWVLVLVLTAIAIYLDIKGPLWWIEYWLTGRELY